MGGQSAGKIGSFFQSVGTSMWPPLCPPAHFGAPFGIFWYQPRNPSHALKLGARQVDDGNCGSLR
jgi:hypothetical protein